MLDAMSISEVGRPVVDPFMGGTTREIFVMVVGSLGSLVQVMVWGTLRSMEGVPLVSVMLGHVIWIAGLVRRVFLEGGGKGG